MNKISVFITAAFLVLVVIGCAWATERTPAGSYLAYRATTVSELRNQVAKNAVVRSRYVRHFGASPAQLDSFFADDLSLISLKEPLRTKCWYIDKSGRQSIKTKLLPRGTMVFATKDGQPVLSWSCGNPLRTDLPVKLVKAETETIAKLPTPESVETKVLANPIETISTAVVAALPAPAVMSALPIAAPPVLATIAAPAVSMAPFISAGSSGFGWLGVLGGLAAGIRGGGGSTTTVVVPEPSSLVALGSLLVLLPGAYRIARRRR